MSLTYSDIATYVDAGNTAAEIAILLNNDFRHVRDCMATSSNPDTVDLLDLLQLYQVLRIGSDATWKGPLVDAVAASGDSALQAGFEQLLTNLQITNRPVRCGTYSSIGKLTSAIVALVKSLPEALAVGTADSIQAAMDDLTGGRRFVNVTEQDVIDALAAKQAMDALDALDASIAAAENAHINPAKASINRTVASVAAAYRAAADAVEAA